MTRAQLGNASYWDEWCLYSDEHIVRMKAQISEPAGDPSYRPQYVFQLAQKHYEQMLRLYSRGDAVRSFARYFAPMLDAWEESERLGKAVWTEKQQYTRHAWAVNLDHYIVCFWLVGLALALEIPDDQWQRLIALIGNEGEDILLDRVIASRQPGRKVGTKLCHPKPYQRLLDAVNAPAPFQPDMLRTFVDHWYAELDRAPKKGLSEKTAMYDRPYWHRYGDENFEGGAYFGRWCVEAVAAVKAFGIDDSLCLGHPNYPGDLLRPDGPSTHPMRAEISDPGKAATVTPKRGLLSRWFGKP
jgi:hypothetical protein